MAVGFSNTNKPLNPRGQDASPKGYNRASLYSGKALDFDGVNNSVDLDGFTMSGTSFSVSFYAKPENAYYLFDSNSPRFLSKYENGFQVYNSIGWTNYGVVPTDSIGFFTIVNEGTTQKAFFNGIQIGNDATITAINLGSTSQFAIGNHYTKSGVPFNGQIANFKAFDVALTAAQVADLYNNPEKVVPTGVADSALKLWLPMMEGAGTTAYDGSGNGNHGTISGATYVHGIGAPVAQTAVIDWNKGTNLLVNSESLTLGGYSTGGSGSGFSVTVTEDYGTAPDGNQTADRIQLNRGTFAELYQRTSVTDNENYVVSFYAKSLSGTPTLYTVWNGTYESPITFTEDWVRYDYEFTSDGTSAGVNFLTYNAYGATSPSADILVWGVQMEKSSNVGPYVRTGATAQTSEVLLPQGLTTGRDITGVNLFENVRKQGALNLDGNSWAEVHDNESLDMTDAITLEAWVYWTTDSADDGILSKWGDAVADRCYMLYAGNGTQVLLFINSVNIQFNGMTTGWHHIIGTYDKVNMRLYVDGIQRSSSTSSTANINTTDKVAEIGTYRHEGSRNYQDQLAQPRIYNRALTASEVLQNYNSGKNTYK